MGLTSKQKMMIAVLLSGTLLVVLNATMLSPALPHIMSSAISHPIILRMSTLLLAG